MLKTMLILGTIFLAPFNLGGKEESDTDGWTDDPIVEVQNVEEPAVVEEQPTIVVEEQPVVVATPTVKEEQPTAAPAPAETKSSADIDYSWVLKEDSSYYNKTVVKEETKPEVVEDPKPEPTPTPTPAPDPTPDPTPEPAPKPAEQPEEQPKVEDPVIEEIIKIKPQSTEPEVIRTMHRIPNTGAGEPKTLEEAKLLLNSLTTERNELKEQIVALQKTTKIITASSIILVLGLAAIVIKKSIKAR